MLFQRIFAFFLALCSIIAATAGIEIPLGKETDDFRVTAYAVAGNIQSENSLHPEDFSIITNIILFGCASFDENGSVNVDEKTLTTALDNINKAKGDNDVIITLNLLGPQRYGDSEDYYEQMDYQAKLHTQAFTSGVLEKNISAVIDRFGFDGVHFDYEYPITNKAWREFNRFLVKMKKEISHKKLGVAISTWDMGLNTSAFAAVDYIELMLYDNYDDAGRHSPADICKSAVREAAKKGLPLDKVNFGLPFYARPTDKDAYWYGYNGYCNGIDENGFYYDEPTGKTFWFNTPDVISEKTDFAITNGFGGVMIWHYSCDLPSSDPASLLKAVNDTIVSHN